MSALYHFVNCKSILLYLSECVYMWMKKKQNIFFKIKYTEDTDVGKRLSASDSKKDRNTHVSVVPKHGLD